MPLFSSRSRATTTTVPRRRGFFGSSGRSTAVTHSTHTAPKRRGFFGSSGRSARAAPTHGTRGGFFHRKNNNRVAGGLKSALANPNTTRSGRARAKKELRDMGRSRETHVPFMTKVKRTLGIRSTPRTTVRKHKLI